MELNSLTAISPLDGRYFKQVESLTAYFSEYALIQYRYRVEVEYLIALMRLGLPELPTLTDEWIMALRGLWQTFDSQTAAKIKETEAVTNHDVKALEYVLREQINSLPCGTTEERKRVGAFVHFALTSQDANNTATPLALKEFLQEVYLPQVKKGIEVLASLAEQWRNAPTPTYTHGQPASPSTMGKEMAVFVERLQTQLDLLVSLPVPAKFGGAVGNFNAHLCAYPQYDWVHFADHFVNDTLGLKRSRLTTQIEHYDGLAAIFDAVRRINVILLDLARDCWAYISLDFFKLKIKANEVGSSTMPHKVNPIDFENAEGNLGLANAIFDHLSGKLPVSRLQRDLTDSTVLRNLGLPFGHTILAMNSLGKGLAKLELNEARMQALLSTQWMLLAEPIQTILKREGIDNAYDLLKQLTRTGEALTQESLLKFIQTLPVSESVKDELRKLSPQTYIGNAASFPAF